jgi:tRNA1Val (adenine37-N6)-methyltransferase
MANHYFQFKQFTIQQDACAMKVTSDACLFGAWVANKIQSLDLKEKHLLDIGAGTGLLSLMVAQQSDAKIDAVEIETAAAIQAQQNFEQSPWNNRLFLHNSSIQNFIPRYKYDFIFTNPPFFFNDLKSENQERNIALHATFLNLDELLQSIVNQLNENSYFAILLPNNRVEEFVNFAKQYSFYLAEIMHVKQTENHNYFRSMLLFSNQINGKLMESEIAIKIDNQYSNEFFELLKTYYLYL